VEGDRVVDFGVDVVVGQELSQAIPVFGNGYYILVVDMAIPLVSDKRCSDVDVFQLFIVVGGVLLPHGVPLIQVRQFHRKDRRLYGPLMGDAGIKVTYTIFCHTW